MADTVGLDVDAETGQSTLVAAEALTEVPALEHLRLVEETENGQLFVDRSGTLVFHDRHHRALDLTVVAVVGDADGEIPYRTAALDSDDGAIWNDVRVTTASGVTAAVVDDESASRYYLRRLSRVLLSDNANEAQACAEYLLLLYADPPARLPAVGLVGASRPEHWPTILTLSNGDRMTWRIRPIPEGGARLIEKDVIVERVTETIQPGNKWETVVDVSPADPFDLWVLGHADRGVLDTTTRMGY